MAVVSMLQRAPIATSRAGRPAMRVMRQRTVVRAQQETPQPPAADPVPEAPKPQKQPSGSPLLGRLQEAVNGRAAMLGMTAAVVSELITHQAIWSQLAGKYVDTQLVEQPVGKSLEYYFVVVSLVMVASLIPQLINEETPDSRKFGLFTPGLETTIGRVAMLAFPLLLLTENVVQAAVF